MLTLNGLDVFGAVLSFPRTGVWHADLKIDTPDDLNGAVVINVDEGRFMLRGTVSAGGNWQATGYLRVVGGADGLPRIAKAKQYASTTVKIVLGDLLAGVGEKLSPRTDAALLKRALPAWTTATISTGRLITQLLLSAAPLATWRVLPDGTVWVGTETWPDSGLTDDDFQVLSEDPSRAEALLGVESPLILPGTLLGGRRVSYVEHRLGDPETRTTVWFETTGSTQDRLKTAIGRMVKGAQPPIDYLSHYFAKVVAQSGGSIDVQPEDARLPSMAGVPLFGGLPQWDLKLNPVGRVLVGWSGGDPAKPYALAFDSDVTAFKLGLFAGHVTIGDKATAQPAILSTPYRAAEDAYLAAISAAIAACAADVVKLGGATAAEAAATLAGIVTAWTGLAPTFLSQQVKHS